MIIKYEFIDGKNIEIEVSTELGQVILQIDKEAQNNNRRETRRHQSLSELSDKADSVADENIDIEEDFLQKFDMDKLYDAISKLKPSEQELIHKLYLDKHPMTQAEYSRGQNTSVGSVKMQLAPHKNKIKKTYLKRYPTHFLLSGINYFKFSKKIVTFVFSRGLYIEALLRK